MYVVEKGSRDIYELETLPDCLVVRPLSKPGAPMARIQWSDLDNHFNVFLAVFLMPDLLSDREKHLGDKA